MMDIYMTGYAGRTGTRMIAARERRILLKHFPGILVEAALREEPGLHVSFEQTDTVMPVGEGGVFAALWKLGELLDCGMEITLGKIPVRQETIEICEFFDLNPYQMISTGAFLAAVPENGRGRQLRGELEKLSGVLIGCTNHSRARIILNGGLVRFIDRPQEDAWNIYEKLCCSQSPGMRRKAEGGSIIQSG